MDKSTVAILQYLGVGLVVGLVSALLGIGGGVLLVPALVLIWKIEMHHAVGTSLVVIVMAALAGSIQHYRMGHVDLGLAGVIAIGAVVGSFFIGAPLADALQADTLKKLFGVLMVIVGLQMTGASAYLAKLLHLVT